MKCAVLCTLYDGCYNVLFYIHMNTKYYFFFLYGTQSFNIMLL